MSSTNQLSKPEEAKVGIAAVSQQSVFIGPLPRPDVLAEYERILPGSAERILKMAENEQEYSGKLIEQNKVAMNLDSLYRSKGQYFAFAITCAAMYLTYAFGSSGMQWLAGIVFSVTLVSIVTAFLGPSFLMKKESRTPKQ